MSRYFGLCHLIFTHSNRGQQRFVRAVLLFNHGPSITVAVSTLDLKTNRELYIATVASRVNDRKQSSLLCHDFKVEQSCSMAYSSSFPGWPEFWFSWAYQLKGLADAGFHVYAMDLRGEPLSKQ